MIYVNATSDGYVLATSKHKPTKMEGWTAVDGASPPRPIAEDDTEPRLMLVDGALVWQVGNTNEDISLLRQSAYEIECDKYQRAYLGYTLEGDTEKAESARMAYLRAKAEVRRRYPYA